MAKMPQAQLPSQGLSHESKELNYCMLGACSDMTIGLSCLELSNHHSDAVDG
jgi:hypothetical protein